MAREPKSLKSLMVPVGVTEFELEVPASRQINANFYLIFTSPKIDQVHLPVLNSTVSL
jgi:hypothetical protein